MKSKKSDDAFDSSLSASRRRFAKSVVASIIATPLVASMARAQKPETKEATAPPNPQPTPTPTTAAQQKPSPVAEAYAEVARTRFGEYTTPEQLEQIKKDIDGNVRSAERLRAAKLKNSDEPDFVFSA